jgi:hypothetical protein
VKLFSVSSPDARLLTPLNCLAQSVKNKKEVTIS